jgi:hypothetical protein
MKTETKNTTIPMNDDMSNRVLTNSELYATIHAAEQLRSKTLYRLFTAAFRFLRRGTARLFDVEAQRHA